MTLSELNKTLRDRAIEYGLCDEWQNTIWNRLLSYEELIRIYIKGIDFSLKNDWLDYELVKREFPIDELHKQNVYIDEVVDIEGGHGYYLFLGSCIGKLTFDGLWAGSVYVMHKSNISIFAYGGAKVLARTYDDGRAISRSDAFSHVTVLNRKKKRGH